MNRYNAAVIAVAAALVVGSYAAGRADAANPDAVAKLNQTIDLLTKARATLNAASTRAGYSSIEKAKASVDVAISETQKAVVANGG